MHELAITESVVEGVSERFGDARVLRVVLQVGRLSGVAVDAVRFCFDACARGTTLEGAVLVIDEIPARARCRTCGARLDLTDMLGVCACGSDDLQIEGGRDVRVREVEID